MRESDIMHENGRFWVAREPFKGRTIYRVYEINGTHSRRCATIDFPKDGLARAINECDKRARDAAYLAAHDAREIIRRAHAEGFAIHHIDGNPRNNAIENLRIVAPEENSRK